jgi:hypothetical protein
MIMRMALTAAIGVASALLVSTSSFGQTIKRMPEPFQFFHAVGDNGSHWGRTPDTYAGPVFLPQAPPPPGTPHHKIREPIESYRAVGDNGTHSDSYQ